MIVDLHSHYFPLDAVRGITDVAVEATERADGSVRFALAGQAMTLPAQLFNLEMQREDLRRQQLARRVLQAPPFTILYELPPATGVAWSRALNDGIAAAARSCPESFIGFATVPLQDVAAAVAELGRATGALGLRGVEILTSINGWGWTRRRSIRSGQRRSASMCRSLSIRTMWRARNAWMAIISAT
jgi:aminocarboxymuconate-semialdehyde decarboxylase